MLEILKETTVWSDGSSVNHTYLLDGNKIVAYAPWHGAEVRIQKTQIALDKRYRKFEKSYHVGLSKLIKSQPKDPNKKVFKVQSGEKEYFVTILGSKMTCTCTGFNFRGKCKHITAVVESQQPA